MEAGAVALLGECWPSTHEALGLVPRATKPAVVLRARNLSAWGMRAGGSEIQGHFWPQSVGGQPGIHETLCQEKRKRRGRG